MRGARTEIDNLPRYEVRGCFQGDCLASGVNEFSQTPEGVEGTGGGPGFAPASREPRGCGKNFGGANSGGTQRTFHVCCSRQPARILVPLQMAHHALGKGG